MSDQPATDVPADITFDPEKKKKKKSSKSKTADDGSAPTESAAAPSAAAEGAAETDKVAADLAGLSLEGAKKKKSSKKKDKDASGGQEDADVEPTEPYTESDRDYTYNEMLSMVIGILKRKPTAVSAPRAPAADAATSGDAAAAADDGDEIVNEDGPVRIPPPVVVPEGARRTMFVNFQEISTLLNRSEDHMSQFLTTELGCTASQNAQGRLVLRIRIQERGVTSIVRRYIREYVQCPMCKSLRTELNRDPQTRLFMLDCKKCGASRSVAPIRQGFVAQVTKTRK
jgi:translation initiation factor 2 subunit 2